MRRMTCHGVCNLEACFLGGDLHGWWKLRELPTKTVGNTPSKKRGRTTQPRLS